MHHDSSSAQPARAGIKSIGKKILGMVMFFFGLVAILGGYVASYVLQNSIAAVLGMIIGFILVIGGAELTGIA
ncbi:MAG: hypothetical protein HYT72_04245 [Candidatus Aenigmarchaeota archaeon]|nr:hypothetical protein [Candidatus Aenigmarchaeota archaeon]